MVFWVEGGHGLWVEGGLGPWVGHFRVLAGEGHVEQLMLDRRQGLPNPNKKHIEIVDLSIILIVLLYHCFYKFRS